MLKNRVGGGKSLNSQVVNQAKTVNGTVVDENGEPLIGVSVLVKGSTRGTVTDFDGKFSLSLSGGEVLQLSYIGYQTQEVKVGNQTILKISLKPDNQVLDEVVIVGYGTQRVKDLTGAATSVKMDEIIDVPGASLVDALSGQVVGLSVSESNGRPGATGTFKVRQPVSFNDANKNFNQPLIVIDDIVQVDENGEPTMTAFNMLDQSEIESMTVLKDASAAVYGSRASAGVILVKTKRGTQGAPRISYSGKLDFSDAVSHAKTMNAYELGVYTNRMFRQTDQINKNTDYAPYLYSDEELEAMRSLNYDWLDKAWHSAVSQRHSLTVNGGSEKVTFFAGVNYQDQQTNLGDVQDFSKWTFRAGGEVKVTSGLRLSASVSGYNTDKVGNNIQVSINQGPWGNSSASKDYGMLRHMPKYIPIETQVFDEASGEMRTYYMSPWGRPEIAG